MCTSTIFLFYLNQSLRVLAYLQGKKGANGIAVEAGHTLRTYTILHQHATALTLPPTRPYLKGVQLTDILCCSVRKLNQKKKKNVLKTWLCALISWTYSTIIYFSTGLFHFADTSLAARCLQGNSMPRTGALSQAENLLAISFLNWLWTSHIIV